MSHCEERLTALPLPLIFLSHVSYVDKDAREGNARGGVGCQTEISKFPLPFRDQRMDVSVGVAPGLLDSVCILAVNEEPCWLFPLT